MVAEHTGDRVRKLKDLDTIYNNASYPGIFQMTPYGGGVVQWAPAPVPNIHARRNGRTVLECIKKIWAKGGMTTYGNDLKIPSFVDPPVYRQV